MKLNMKKLALAFGVIWALYVVWIAWVAGAIGWGDKIVDVLASLYRGYDATFLGGLIGGAWGFVDGAIAGVIVAWVYNKLKA